MTGGGNAGENTAANKKRALHIVKNTASVTAILLIILYVIYQSFGGFSGTLSTVITRVVTDSETISGNAYIFRDEKVILGENAGAVKHLAGDGAYVSVGDRLAEIYSEPTASDVYAERAELERRLALLESCLRTDFSEVVEAEQKTAELIKNIKSSLEGGNASEALAKKEALLEYMNRLEVFGISDTYAREEKIRDEIDRIEVQLSSLDYSFSGSHTSLSADRSGYYYYSADGYENIFSFDALEELTPEKLYFLAAESPEDVSGIVCRMVYDFEWYIAIPISADAARNIEEGKYYSVFFPGDGQITLKMYLERIIESADSDEAILVLSTMNMPKGFAYSRMQNVVITLSETRGYSVPASALRTVDGEQGVYVLNAGNVYFRKVNVLKSCDGYYIVAERDTDSENYYEFLNLNDNIITSGKNLYDGKVIG